MAALISCDVKGCTETGLKWPEYFRWEMVSDSFYFCIPHGTRISLQINKYLQRVRDVGMKLEETADV